MADLLWETTVDVLSRLSAKDLLRCRSVCKAWRSLIDGPDFIKMHLNHSIETNSHMGVVISCSDPYWVDSDTLESTVRLEALPPIYGGERIEVLGSCNGLLALTNRNGDMVLWNPSTRRSRSAFDILTEVSVFAFDFVTEDYRELSFPDQQNNEKSYIKLGEYGVKESWTKLFSVVPSNVTGKRVENVMISGMPDGFDHSSTFCVGGLVGVDGGFNTGKKPAGENGNKIKMEKQSCN
ncbi:F-box domain containing protein [Trema orientale]|uniref:F-box domain containing protein n=1 Tax=Trema orientale TaxID=63057 RepID=A0A2P5CCH7_TREOI|nr:F-box domain containing protein [Trema orientale]